MIRMRRSFVTLSSSSLRQYASSSQIKNGVVLGVYKNGEQVCLTKEAEKFDQAVAGRLTQQFQHADVTGKAGSTRLFYGLADHSPCVAVVGLGDLDKQSLDDQENLHQGRENVRRAVAGGVLALREVSCSQVTVDGCDDPEAGAEGAQLALWSFDELKSEKNRKQAVSVSQADGDSEAWVRGLHKSAGQNLARTLMEAPANLITPSHFCQRVSAALAGLPVEVTVRDQAWIEQRRMGAFLSVARGSEEPPRFLELSYQGGRENSAPLALVGKGVTFDAGGISIKPAANMDKMRADLGGAACTAGVLYSAALLGLPANLRAFIPLCENLPSGRATKPGDVVTASNGKTIQVDNTDAEGRLILADALCYAQQVCKPRAILDMATLTGAMAVALGAAAAGVFTNSTAAWRHLRQAGSNTGDRVWRMPLWQHFTKQMTECDLADVNNLGADRVGGSCTAAAFLREFVSEDVPWLHLDIAGVMENKTEVPYLCKGMTGRPTRTVLEFAETFCRDE